MSLGDYIESLAKKLDRAKQENDTLRRQCFRLADELHKYQNTSTLVKEMIGRCRMVAFTGVQKQFEIDVIDQPENECIRIDEDTIIQKPKFKRWHVVIWENIN